MIDFPNIDEDDEMPDELASEATSQSTHQTSAAAIANLSFEAALDRKTRTVLKTHPSLSIIKIPGADWVDLVEAAVKRMERAPIVKTAIEQRKYGGTVHRVGVDELRWLHGGQSMMFISQDPEGILDNAVVAAADALITIPPLSAERLRQVIRQVTGGSARGVTEEMTALDLDIIVNVIRPGMTSGQCVTRLRRALNRRPVGQASTVPLLSELPLTQEIRTWSDRFLADLIAVKAGNMSPDQLVYGVLEGPPGTGKTLIAESITRTAGWNFVSSSVGSWFTVGDGALGGVARNLKGFVDTILASEPCCGLLDELDAIPSRETMDNRGRDWWTPVITQFLVEIDRLRRSGQQVVLIGTTNHYSHLDPALIRPGRLQQRVSVLPPKTEAEALDLLRYFLREDLPESDLERLARYGRGASPAAVEGWTKEARALARSYGRPLVIKDVFEQMVPRDPRTPEDIHAAAVHEIGHAVIACRVGRTVRNVSIVAQGITGGLTETSLLIASEK